MANVKEQLARMKELYTYGMTQQSTSRNNGTGILEFHKIAADGKSYGIIRECNKYYIKTAPVERETLVEAYDYIGGFMNKKENEYSSCAQAMKDFELKLRSINESCGGHADTTVVDPAKFKVAEGENASIMQESIRRQREIMKNVQTIINEGSFVGVGDPERVSGSNDEDKPFIVKGKAELDKDVPEAKNDPEEQGNPFGEKKAEEKPEDAKLEGSVAAEHPKGAMSVKMNEGKCEKCGCEDGKCTCGACNEDADVDGLEDEPDAIDVEMAEVEPEPEVEEKDEDSIEDDADFSEEEDAEDEEDLDLEDEDEADEVEDLQDEVSELKAEIEKLKALVGAEDEEDVEIEDFESEDDAEDVDAAEDESVEDADEDEEEKEFEVDTLGESKSAFFGKLVESVVKSVKKDRINESETVLHDFGKHPGYRKKPIAIKGGEEGKPFGQKIGDGSPFDEKVVNIITDCVVAELKKKI